MQKLYIHKSPDPRVGLVGIIVLFYGQVQLPYVAITKTRRANPFIVKQASAN